MKSLNKIILPSLFSVVVSSMAFAGGYTQISKIENSTQHPWFVGVSLGAAWPSLNGSATVPNGNTFAPPANAVDTYSITHTNSAAEWSLFAGYRWMRSQRFFPIMSLALRYSHIDSFNVTGTIDQYSLPGFINYNYSTKVSPNLFLLLGKFDIYRFHSLAPFVSAGIGAAVNYFSNYNEQALAGIIPRVSPGYTDKTNTNFAYTLGVGLDYFLNPLLTASLGYEYADLGNVGSGDGVSTWSGTSLSYGKLTSNSVLASLSYQLPA